MKNWQFIIILIIILLVIFHRTIIANLAKYNLFPFMAEPKYLYPHIFKWEGGIVNDSIDKGGLTNKGVTFSTFKALAVPVLNIQPTSENFAKLTVQQTQKIIDWYWNKVKASKIVNQEIANMIVDFYWGSGSWSVSRTIRVLNNEYGYKIKDFGKSSLMTDEIIFAINKTSPVKLLESLKNSRIDFYKAIVLADPTQKKFYNGWVNRTNDLYA